MCSIVSNGLKISSTLATISLAGAGFVLAPQLAIVAAAAGVAQQIFMHVPHQMREEWKEQIKVQITQITNKIIDQFNNTCGGGVAIVAASVSRVIPIDWIASMQIRNVINSAVERGLEWAPTVRIVNFCITLFKSPWFTHLALPLATVYPVVAITKLFMQHQATLALASGTQVLLPVVGGFCAGYQVADLTLQAIVWLKPHVHCTTVAGNVSRYAGHLLAASFAVCVGTAVPGIVAAAPITFGLTLGVGIFSRIQFQRINPWQLSDHLPSTMLINGLGLAGTRAFAALSASLFAPVISSMIAGASFGALSGYYAADLCYRALD